MGSKSLKAVIAREDEYKIVPARPEYFKKIRKVLTDDLNNNKYTSVYYRRYGTAANVRWSEENIMLPVNNFRDGTHVDINSVSGQTLETKHMTGSSENVVEGHIFLRDI
ncbi:MAG TPA: aldehyde ferredoxin oxidoreductase C-terminal domain-containing protein [Bacteroidales bacterium]|nr:aldehyde ferredoxin oxidoreductase C-terminal domain-containing protein [Bacteroidales bacterium]